MMDDIILNKKESIERCVKQIRAYYGKPSELPFEEDFFKQDAIAINIQRASELCIDLANHIVKLKRLGIPKESKESFALLAQAGIIPNFPRFSLWSQEFCLPMVLGRQNLGR